MTSPLFSYATEIRAALLAAEQLHPGSTALDRLHTALYDGLNAPGVAEALGFAGPEFAQLGGGTPKDVVPDDGSGDGPAPGNG